jgi:hypothetical protein
MTGLPVAAAIAAADAGPVLTAELYPLSGAGKVRVTYNWLYSALNVDPGDSSPFAWVFQKNSDGSVALSPQDGCDGAFAWVSQKMPDGSVALSPEGGLALWAWPYPDDSFRYVAQVQAPGVDGDSPMWSTAPFGMTLTGLGLLIVELLDSDGSGNYIGVDGSITSQDGHAGYLIPADAGTPGPSSKFFVAVQQNLQAGAQAPLFSSLSAAEVSAELGQQGAGDPQALTEVIFAASRQVT